VTTYLTPYGTEVCRLAKSSTTREESYYPAIKALLTAVLETCRLPFEVRTATSEKRAGGGVDLPDLAFYDGPGEFIVVCCEVKKPTAEIEELAQSCAQGDQVGRYLALTGVVLLSNVRSIGLLTVTAGPKLKGAVPPNRRHLQAVTLWPSRSALTQGKPADDSQRMALEELVELAVTRFASVHEPASLARILARQAQRAKADLPREFSQAVKGLLEDYGKALGVCFEGTKGEGFFRSSLVQTVFYALFAAWALWHRSGGAGRFDWKSISDYLKIPFLAGLFYELKHPTRLKELGLARHLDTAADTLARVDRSAFFARFHAPALHPKEEGSASGASASVAITYFYEPFLEAYDPELRKTLGVWYTPREIVYYQVRNIHRILREHLGCERGFADERVVVLDPCCGTGAYLLEVMRCVADQLECEGEKDFVGAKLLEACQNRILGFEILTAPFVVSHLQIYLLLAELDATPDESHRPAVYLTNALTGWDEVPQLKLNFPELQEEHDLASKVKREAKIIVILGNPPYNRFAGMPIAEESDLVDHYKGIQRDDARRQVGQSRLYAEWGIRKHLLDDLYIRFFRLAEKRIGERAESGVVSFISNSSYLTGRSHPIMRESILRHFKTVWIDNLNGDKYRTGKIIPPGIPGAGRSDQSVFVGEHDPGGIQVGTAIATLLKVPLRPAESLEPGVFYRDFWGRAEDKRRALVESLERDKWSNRRQAGAAKLPEGPRPYVEFRPEKTTAWKLVPASPTGGYEDWPALDELFPIRWQGINPNRGLQGSVVEIDAATLRARMKEYFSDMPFEKLSERHPVLCQPRARFDPRATRKSLQAASRYQGDRVIPYLVFPLDDRWLYYEDKAKLLNERRPELWENLGDNEFLIAVPQPRRLSESRPILATCAFDLHLHDRGSVCFPRRGRLAAQDPDLFSAPESDPALAPNLAPKAYEALTWTWRLAKGMQATRGQQLTAQMFRLCMAVCHSPQYEEDHKESLAQDWARVPIPKVRQTFDDIAALGDTVALLLDPLRDATRVIGKILGKSAATLGVPGKTEGGHIHPHDFVVEYAYYAAAPGRWIPRAPHQSEAVHARWGESTGDLFINERARFRHVPQAVWRYELGGYPVLKKWLGYRDKGRRPGQVLSIPEMEHFRGMIHRIAALLALHDELDAAYERAAADCFKAKELGIGS